MVGFKYLIQIKFNQPFSYFSNINQSHKMGINMVIRLSLCWLVVNQFVDLQGFGTDMPLSIDEEIMVSSQTELQNRLHSNLLIRIVPGSQLQLTSNIILKNLHDVVILGPATLINFGIYIEYSQNVIVENIRIFNASIYGVLISHSHFVVVDHCTIIDAGRMSVDQGKSIDVTEDTSNVTISFCLLGFTSPISQLVKHKGLLAANFLYGPVTNISIHHNLFYCTYQRSPEISSPGLFDLRENLIFNYTEYGSRVRNEAKGNFIRNWYIGGKKDPLVILVDPITVFVSANSWKFNCKEDRSIPDIQERGQFPVPLVTSKSVKEVVKSVGCESRGIMELMMTGEVSRYL